MRDALVLIDFQNDFCEEARGRGVDIAAITRVLDAAASLARARAIEVIFVRFHGDEALQKPNWRARDHRLGRTPHCLAGTAGAEFHGPQPRPGERIFTKPACWDAFLCAGFEEHLAQQGIGTLLLAGLYADVCIDSTARSAFQKGFGVHLLADGSASRYRPQAEVLQFLHTVCDAGILDAASLAKRWPA